MKWRINQKKLIFMNQIIHLEETALAKQIQLIQDREGLPGLTSEVRSLVEELELPNLFDHTIPPTRWKNMVKKAVTRANEDEVKKVLVSYKKLKNRNIVNEHYGMKPYMETLSVYEARTIFKHKTSITHFVKLNFKGVKKYKAEGWKCDECSQHDSEEHLLWCQGYTHFCENMNLENEKELSQYLHKIFLKRKGSEE